MQLEGARSKRRAQVSGDDVTQDDEQYFDEYLRTSPPWRVQQPGDDLDW